MELAILIHVRIKGLTAVQIALRKLPNATAKNVIRRVLRKRAKPIADRARELAPEEFGDLKKSITVGTKLSKAQRARHHKAGRDDVEVFVGAGPHPQAHLQEFGTKNHPPQPFMRPAWDAEKDGVLTGLKSDLWAEIKKTAQRLVRKTRK